MSLDQPQANKMMTAPPAKKEYHFAATGEHLAEVVYANSIQEAEAAYHRVKRLINPQPEQSTPLPEQEAEEKSVQ